MNLTTKQADEYIGAKATDGRRPKYHLAPPVGWMNDPNGLTYYRGAYHLFYQYHPYDTLWGPMHWGHARSEDLLSFEPLPVALAPDGEEEDGCFSGGAVVRGDELVLLYTRHYEREGFKRQVQCKAVSRDGVRFTKERGVCIDTAGLPEGASRTDFRDPNPVRIGDRYFIFVGSKNERDEGQILVFESSDLSNFTYFTTIFDKRFGVMAECPDFFTLGGKDVLILSAIALPREGDKFRNVSACVYAVGKFDLEQKRFDIEYLDEIDGGYDFYAPQTLLDGRGRRVMMAWLQIWGEKYFLHEKGFDWNGSMTAPRVLSLKGGRLCQQPIDELKNYYGAEIDYFDGATVTKVQDAEFVLSEGASVRFENPALSQEYFELGVRDKTLYFDGSALPGEKKECRRVCGVDGDCVSVRLLLDSYSAEAFVGGGEHTFTAAVFMGGDRYRVRMSGGAYAARAHEITVRTEETV